MIELISGRDNLRQPETGLLQSHKGELGHISQNVLVHHRHPSPNLVLLPAEVIGRGLHNNFAELVLPKPLHLVQQFGQVQLRIHLQIDKKKLSKNTEFKRK